MTNRREFLQIGIAATAWPLASSAAGAVGGSLPDPTAMPMHGLIYDRRFPASLAFAERAAARGLDVHAIEGDMTRYWFEELYHVWKQQPVAIAGLTAHGPLFCFDMLGRDQGLRVVFRAEHRSGIGGGSEHRLSGPLPMLQQCMQLRNDPDSWGQQMADVVAECPSGRVEIAHARTGIAPAPDAAATDALYTWVIAPVVRTVSPPQRS